MTRQDLSALAMLCLAGILAAGCTREASTTDSTATTTDQASRSSLTLYSGRNENLIGPLIEKFTADTGIQVSVRYGDTAELAATLMEESQNSPADLFLAQDAGALGAVSAAGLLHQLPQDLLSRVPEQFRSSTGDWLGVSGRARTIVYNPRSISPNELPRSLTQVADQRYRGRFGVAPTNASFQAHMAVYRVLSGEQALRDLLEAMVDNQPRRYAKNGAIVQAVADGEVDFGLVNHYYALQAKKEQPDLPVENFFMPEGDASSFVNVAGVGVVRESEPARRFVEYLLSDDAQRYFAEQTFEYPVTSSVPPPANLPPLDQIRTPAVDMKQVSQALEPTLTAIQQSGLVQ